MHTNITDTPVCEDAVKSRGNVRQYCSRGFKIHKKLELHRTEEQLRIVELATIKGKKRIIFI